jgi:hypothetical protein
MSVPISKLQPLKKRFFGSKSYTKRFGSTLLSSLPSTLGRPRLSMPDQGVSDLCTPYGEAVSGSYKYGILMSAAYQTGMESKYYGYPIIQGADALGSMDASLVFDHLPITKCSYTLQTEGINFITDPKNFDTSLQKDALPYFPGIPYKVDGPYDVFDNIRSALFQEWSIDKSVVKVFGHWYDSWNTQARLPELKGKLTIPTDTPITLHRYNFIDWITDDSGIYLVAALTQDDAFGDHSHLYMNRECVNKVFENMSDFGLGLYIAKPSTFDLTTTFAWFRIILKYLKFKNI